MFQPERPRSHERTVSISQALLAVSGGHEDLEPTQPTPEGGVMRTSTWCLKGVDEHHLRDIELGFASGPEQKDIPHADSQIQKITLSPQSQMNGSLQSLHS